MEDKIPDKSDLLQALIDYKAYELSGHASEDEADRMAGELDLMVPHARITDLVFYPDMERTDEEIVDEALYRENLWQTQGNLALLLHLRTQMEQAERDPGLAGLRRHHVMQTLEEISAEIAKLNRETLQ